MKVALVHDWLTGMRGGERCLLAFLKRYPEADIFTLVHVPGSTHPRIDARVKQTSVLNKLPGVSRYYRALLPLFPWAISQFNFEGYDLIVSLSHAAAKNIRVPEKSKHICYCFTPMRYIWDQARNYLGAATPLFWPLIMALRRWDASTSVQSGRRVDHFVAISQFIAARIRCFYGRRASVIYPPVESSWVRSSKDGQKGVAFLYAGALVPYKKTDLVIKAFNLLGLPLWVVGSGPEEKRLRKMAKKNITFFGRVSDPELGDFYARCRALVFPGVEDFGMIPVECLAAGRPVIGIHRGGLKESLIAIKPWGKSRVSSDSYPTLEASSACGVFIRVTKQDEFEALLESIKLFVERESEFSSIVCRERAKRFSPSRFYEEWDRIQDQVLMPSRSESRASGQN